MNKMKILDIFRRKKKEESIIKKNVNILSIRYDTKVDFDFAFAFTFYRGEDGKKKSIVSINNEKVILDEGQSCIFIMKSGDSDPIRLKAKPDFKNEGCRVTWCHDSNAKDDEI